MAASYRLYRTAFEMSRAQAQGEKKVNVRAEPAEAVIAEEVVPSAMSTPPQFLPIPIAVDDHAAPGAADLDHHPIVAEPDEAQEPEIDVNTFHEPDAGGLGGGMDVDVIMQKRNPCCH